MPEAHNSQPFFPVSQRELVGLALAPGARRPHTAPPAPHSQRERVRLALALGMGAPKGTSRGSRGPRR
jgi:hypothetical protein